MGAPNPLFLGLVPSNRPHSLGYSCTLYAPTSPLLIFGHGKEKQRFRILKFKVEESVKTANVGPVLGRRVKVRDGCLVAFQKDVAVFGLLPLTARSFLA